MHTERESEIQEAVALEMILLRTSRLYNGER